MLIFQNIIKFFTFKTSGFYFGRILVNLYTPKCWKLCKHCIPKRSSSYCANLFCDFSFILINCGTFIHFNFAFNLIIFFHQLTTPRSSLMNSNRYSEKSSRHKQLTHKCIMRQFLHLCVGTFFHTDICESTLSRQSGPNLHHTVCHGGLGVLVCWRIFEEPQTLPHL